MSVLWQTLAHCVPVCEAEGLGRGQTLPFLMRVQTGTRPAPLHAIGRCTLLCPGRRCTGCVHPVTGAITSTSLRMLN